MVDGKRCSIWKKWFNDASAITGIQPSARSQIIAHHANPMRLIPKPDDERALSLSSLECAERTMSPTSDRATLQGLLLDSDRGFQMGYLYEQ